MMLTTARGIFRVCNHKVGGEMIRTYSCEKRPTRLKLVRIHSGCEFGDSMDSLHCDCGQQKKVALRAIQLWGSGVFVYSPHQEGRGHGIEIKIIEMHIAQTNGWDSVQAFRSMGLEHDIRSYEREIEALHDLDLPKRIIHLSGNPRKAVALQAGGFEIVCPWDPKLRLGKLARQERAHKVELMGYEYPTHTQTVQ